LVAVVMLRVGWRHGLELFGCLGAIWAVFFYFWYRDNPLDNPKLIFYTVLAEVVHSR
jgi:hypothetical protein